MAVVASYFFAGKFPLISQYTYWMYYMLQSWESGDFEGGRYVEG